MTVHLGVCFQSSDLFRLHTLSNTIYLVSRVPLSINHISFCYLEPQGRSDLPDHYDICAYFDSDVIEPAVSWPLIFFKSVITTVTRHHSSLAASSIINLACKGQPSLMLEPEHFLYLWDRVIELKKLFIGLK